MEKSMKRLKELINEYGPIAIGTYLVIFVLVLTGFALAIHFGFEPDGVAGGLGLLAAAWLATKATQPLRIAATFALTPVVARVVRRSPASTAAPVPTPDPEPAVAADK